METLKSEQNPRMFISLSFPVLKRRKKSAGKICLLRKTFLKRHHFYSGLGVQDGFSTTLMNILFSDGERIKDIVSKEMCLQS